MPSVENIKEVMSMKKILLIIIFIITATSVDAETIQYIDTGKKSPCVKIVFSRNNGSSWKENIIRKGQSCNLPKDVTNLFINNVPYDPKKNYKIKDGNVFIN